MSISDMPFDAQVKWASGIIFGGLIDEGTKGLSSKVSLVLMQFSQEKYDKAKDIDREYLSTLAARWFRVAKERDISDDEWIYYNRADSIAWCMKQYLITLGYTDLDAMQEIKKYGVDMGNFFNLIEKD